MHILVVNDDGPPSTHSSPYVHSLVRDLQAAGHLVSVCLPHTQRSWIGKAHIIGQTVEPIYYRPPALDRPPAGIERTEGEGDNEGTVHKRPFGQQSSGAAETSSAASPSPEEWVLVNGTPASCVQIGLYHVFRSRAPIDLVVSGPNYGRNTTAVFALSSGTLGGALEAATCNKPAIALSYAFFNRNHDRAIIAEASRHAVRVIEALYRQWPRDGSVDLYSVNVPLQAGVASRKTVFAGILQNYWRDGGCFVAVDVEEHAEAVDAEEEHIRAGLEGDAAEEGGESTGRPSHNVQHGHTTPLTHQHFKWQPRFGDVYRSVDEAPPGNDGWAVREGFTSITPLKANFFQAATELQQTEFQLDPPGPKEAETVVDESISRLSIGAATESTPEAGSQAEASTLPPPGPMLYALVDYDDPYVQPIIVGALKEAVPPGRLQLVRAPQGGPAAATMVDREPVSLQALIDGLGNAGLGDNDKILQITPYEAIDFDYAASRAAAVVVNSYIIRKALIRKHFLAATVEQWVAKRPQSVLAGHVQRAEAFEVDYAEFLDDALVEAFDLRASLDANEAVGPAQRQWWILKPSMSDRGQGIRLFSTTAALQAIFDGWEGGSDSGNEDDYNDAVAAADLRHFVAQPYIHPPLLLPGTGGRKFHVRVYVLCVGALRVYVHRSMLALFAAKPYTAPWQGAAKADGDDAAPPDLAAHLTNTCLQDEVDKGDAVWRFWDLPEPSASSSGTSCKDAIFGQICRVTGEVFEAAAVAAPIHFQPLAHAFEVYGLDFLVGAPSSPSSSSVTAWLLEVNAFPDFRQTGTGLMAVVGDFWKDALRVVVRQQVFGEASSSGDGSSLGGLVLVKDVDLGRR